MILFSKEEGFIKPRGIHFKEEQDVNIKLPEVAIGVFSRHLFEDIVQKFSCKEVGYISCANLERNICKWFTVSTDIYKLEDGFIGVTGVSDLKPEGLVWSDCDYPTTACEYEEYTTISYRPK